MSPEQASGFGYIDGRSDLYSLGLVIYEMLVGEPYARRRVPLAQARPETPPALIAIVEKLIQKDPDQRYQSAGDLVTDLGRLSTAPPRATTADAYAIPTPAPGPYPPAPPSQPGGYPGAVSGVPSAYGGRTERPARPVWPAVARATGHLRRADQWAAATASLRHAATRLCAAARLPPQKRGGFPPLAIVGIIAAVLIVAIAGIALAASRGGGGPRPPRCRSSTQVASAATATTITTTVVGSTPTANAIPAASATATTNARPPGTPTSLASTVAAPTATSARGSTTPLAGLGTARPTTGGATPFPTASNQVKLAAGKPLPTNGGPNVYVDRRESLHRAVPRPIGPSRPAMPTPTCSSRTRAARSPA